MESCQTCQYFGPPLTQNNVQRIETSGLFQRFGLDFVGPLPRTKNGNRFILVATEYLSKWPLAKAVPNADAKTVAKFIYEEIVSVYGCPQEILTDRGSHFKNEMLENLASLFKIKHKFTSAYHPQTNGLTERFNKTLCDTLKKAALDNSLEWDLQIAPALLAYRVRPQSTTKKSPFELLYGVLAVLPISATLEVGKSASFDLDRREGELIDLNNLRSTLVKAIKKKNPLERRGRPKRLVKNYEVGDLVLLHKPTMGSKLEPAFAGPFVIVEKRDNVYQLRSPGGKILRGMVNTSRLKPFFLPSGDVPTISGGECEAQIGA